MDIEKLEDRLESIADEKYSAIIKLIINAVRDYPLFDLNDTNLYFEELKKIIKSDSITPDSLEKAMIKSSKKDNENSIWFVSSLSSMLDAFDLMKIYKISFEEVVNKIESLG